MARRLDLPPVRSQLVFLLYLTGLTLAEIVTVLVDTRSGVVGYALLLMMSVAHAATYGFRAGAAQDPRSSDRRLANLFIALALVPLIRIVSLALPLSNFPEWSWYGVIAVPLLGAAWAAGRSCGYGRVEIGLCLGRGAGWWFLTLAIGACGVGLGYLEYQILRPEPLVATERPLLVLAVSLTLLIGTGLTEEVIFRGVLQLAAVDVLGVGPGIAYASALFAVLHIGHKSVWDIPFVFAVAVLFAIIVMRTRSLAGVVLAHGVTNICLFLVFPHLLGTG
jgi:membrane protease YdiL (CAAX protease family)